MRSITAIAAVALLGVSAQAGATVLFSENFDSITANTLQITTTAASMTVTGAVDALVPVNPFGVTGLASTVIDLDGSPGPGGVSSPGSFTISPGFVYKLSFVIGGSQSGGRDRVIMSVNYGSPFTGTLQVFGHASSRLLPAINTPSFSGSFDLAPNAPFLATGITMTPAFRSVRDVSFSIRTSSVDSAGPLLDSVTFTRNAVPEPASWAMLIAGFGLVGAAMRRRTTAQTA